MVDHRNEDAIKALDALKRRILNGDVVCEDFELNEHCKCILYGQPVEPVCHITFVLRPNPIQTPLERMVLEAKGEM